MYAILTLKDAGESVDLPLRIETLNVVVAFQASNIKAISKGSDHSVHVRRLFWAFAYRTYHIFGNLMLWFIRIWTSLMLFIEMLRQAITDLFCCGAKSRGVV